MLIIPAINCKSSECVKKKLKIASKFAKWVQIDVADGKFANYKTWNEPEKLNSKLKLEVHLMVKNPKIFLNKWVKAGAKRIIVHLEAINGLGPRMYADAAKSVELGLAINPQTSVKRLMPYLKDNKFRFVQILSVSPGPAGQKFHKSSLAKIKFLKQKFPSVIIEVDGGINLETAKLCRKAGADILVSGAYIFENTDPQKAYSGRNAQYIGPSARYKKLAAIR